MLALATVAGVVAASPPALAAVAASSPTRLTTVSTDPFTNPSSYQATELEPDTFAVGSTIVGAFQTGRFFDGGSSDTGWATSLDGGRHWVHGFLLDTVYSGGPFARISDPAVAYDRKHRIWLISGLTAPPSSPAAHSPCSRSDCGQSPRRSMSR